MGKREVGFCGLFVFNERARKTGYLHVKRERKRRKERGTFAPYIKIK